MSWSEFFAMGGYGFYVWSAYGFGVVVMALNVIIPLHRRRVVTRILRELIRVEMGHTK